MSDQRAELEQYIWNRYPELDPEDIAKCVEAIGAWLETQA